MIDRTQLFARHLCRNDSGSVAVTFAILAVVLIASAGVALDLARAFSARTDMQAAADAAATGAAAANVATDDLKVGIAQKLFASNSNWGDVQPSVTLSGSVVTVTATTTLPTTLMGVVGIKEMPIPVTAAADLAKGLPVCVLALDPAAPDALYAWGSTARIQAPDCVVHSNSASSSALNGSSGVLSSAAKFCAVGGYQGTSFSPRPKTGCRAVLDPYVNTPAPRTTGCDFTDTTITSPTTLTAGVYCGGLRIQSQGVTLQPGVYVIKDGELKINSGATATGSDIVFFLTGNSNLAINGGAIVDWSAPTSGPYTGMIFVQDRRDVPDKESTITGGADVRIVGVGYFPMQRLDVGGSGDFGATSPFMMFVANQFNFHGNGTMNVSFDAVAAGMAGVPIPVAFSGSRLTR